MRKLTLSELAAAQALAREATLVDVLDFNDRTIVAAAVTLGEVLGDDATPEVTERVLKELREYGEYVVGGGAAYACVLTFANGGAAAQRTVRARYHK